MPGIVPPNPFIFHITHVENLAGIVSHGCLWSDAQRISRGLNTTNIGYSHIKSRRLNRPVSAGAGGKLGDYVPFNFCARSVMLYVVSKGHTDYTGGQSNIVHLVSSVDRAVALGKPWAFTDQHADLAYASYFSSRDALREVNWDVMPMEWWGGNDDLKARRQAEFLVHDSFPWSAIEKIGVQNATIAAKVAGLVTGQIPTVAIHPDWYY